MENDKDEISSMASFITKHCSSDIVQNLIFFSDPSRSYLIPGITQSRKRTVISPQLQFLKYESGFNFLPVRFTRARVSRLPKCIDTGLYSLKGQCHRCLVCLSNGKIYFIDAGDRNVNRKKTMEFVIFTCR